MARHIERPALLDPVVRAALASVPTIGPALAELFNYARELDEWRIQQMAEAARAELGNDELLTQRLREDERFVDLVVTAVESSRRSAWEGKRITMGRVLGHALMDDADIDEEAALLTALGAIEAPHFRLLAKLEAEVAGPIQDGTLPQPYGAALIAHGLIRIPNGTWGGVAGNIEVTSFGKRLLAWVRESNENRSVDN